MHDYTDTHSVCVCTLYAIEKYRASLSLKGILISKSNKQIKGDLEVVGPEIKFSMCSYYCHDPVL